MSVAKIAKNVYTASAILSKPEKRWDKIDISTSFNTLEFSLDLYGLLKPWRVEMSDVWTNL